MQPQKVREVLGSGDPSRDDGHDHEPLHCHRCPSATRWSMFETAAGRHATELGSPGCPVSFISSCRASRRRRERGRFQILSLDGGGFRGMFSAAVLARLEEDLGTRIADHFDLIAGTSTGGIIALGLGLGLSPREITAFYTEHGPRIFRDRTRTRSLRRLLEPSTARAARAGALRRLRRADVRREHQAAGDHQLQHGRRRRLPVPDPAPADAATRLARKGRQRRPRHLGRADVPPRSR